MKFIEYGEINIMTDVNWKDAVKNAEAYKIIGNTDIHLFNWANDSFPWKYVTDMEIGGSGRLNLTTSVTFVANHPIGITFKWFSDLELKGANGTATYKIDIENILKTAAKLPLNIQQKYSNYLEKVADEIFNKGKEYQEIAGTQFSQSFQLLQLVNDIQDKQ